jgi:hypothetical protein
MSTTRRPTAQPCSLRLHRTTARVQKRRACVRSRNAGRVRVVPSWARLLVCREQLQLFWARSVPRGFAVPPQRLVVWRSGADGVAARARGAGTGRVCCRPPARSAGRQRGNLRPGSAAGASSSPARSRAALRARGPEREHAQPLLSCLPPALLSRPRSLPFRCSWTSGRPGADRASSCPSSSRNWRRRAPSCFLQAGAPAQTTHAGVRWPSQDRQD